MSQTLTFNPNQSRPIPMPIRSLTCEVGSCVVAVGAGQKLPDDESQPDQEQHPGTVDSTNLAAGETFTADHGRAQVTVFSVEGASVSFIYADDPEETEPAERGDSAGEGSTGSFESRTLTELRALAKERGLTGLSKANKDDVIAALRGE
jgi:hypothetical protein